MTHHKSLRDEKPDQLSLAAVHFSRSHHQEAVDIYKRVLLESREDLAVNVYIAMCYYKLDYYDVSLEILSVYLQAFPDSLLGVNLKACNHFRLYNGKAAETELKVLSDHGVNLQASDLVRHNMVVFSNGEQAMQVLPPLVDVLPEARLNLVIYHLKSDAVNEAYELVRDLDPSTPQVCYPETHPAVYYYIAGVHSQGRCARLAGAGLGVAGPPEDGAAVLPAGGHLGARVRHDPRPAVHGQLLLPDAPVRRREHLPQLGQGLHVQRRRLQPQPR